MSGIRESTDVGYDGLARVASVLRKISGTSGVNQLGYCIVLH